MHLGRLAARSVAVLAAVVVVAALAAPASAARWNFETNDGAVDNATSGSVDSNAGLFNASVVWNGTPHVWYWDGGFGALRHAWWTGTAWRYETLDGTGTSPGNGRVQRNVGEYVSVTVWNNEPHVFYYDQDNDDLRHGWYNGRGWFFETLDGDCAWLPCSNGRTTNNVGWHSTATVWNGTPHVWYSDETGRDLRHAWWTGSAWFFETLDGTCGWPCTNGRTTNEVGRDTTVTVWNNQPHVWYSDTSDGQLRHGWWTGSAWQFEALDGTCPTATCPNGSTANIVGADGAATVWAGTPHVWYHDQSDGYLRHGWWTGSQWRFETLDGAGGPNGRVISVVGVDNSVTVWNGEPHVWYWDNPNGTLRHGWWNGSAWLFEALDGDCPSVPCANGSVTDLVGRFATATVWGGQPHVWYQDLSNANVRHGWYG